MNQDDVLTKTTNFHGLHSSERAVVMFYDNLYGGCVGILISSFLLFFSLSISQRLELAYWVCSTSLPACASWMVFLSFHKLRFSYSQQGKKTRLSQSGIFTSNVSFFFIFPLIYHRRREENHGMGSSCIRTHGKEEDSFLSFSRLLVRRGVYLF